MVIETSKINNMKYTNYNKLSKIGDDGELRFVQFLKNNSFTHIQHIDEVFEEENLSRSDWDIRATNELGDTLTFEVKTQQDCHKYGYFNVEQVQNGKPGGIAVSKADVWVFVNDTLGFGMVDANDLKKIHNNIRKDITVKKQSYIDKIDRDGIKLWITKFKNFAAGFRMENNRLNWIK